MNHALRIIDANANRAREALRVMEDAARFVLDHGALCERLKNLRHGLASALSGLPAPGGDGLAWRDADRDVGTDLRGAGEYRREGVRGVVVAAGKRLTEALRSLEEYAKTLAESGAAHGAAFESLRYRAYDIERDLVLAMGGTWAGGADRAGRGWRLCVLITASLCPRHGWLETARRAIAGGADMLQLREKGLDGRELLERARTLAEVARSASPRVTLIVNDRPDIALLSGADGVHLGQSDMGVRDARRIVGSDLLVGVSTESIEQGAAARAEGADYCGIGPMFATSTKLKPRVAGVSALRGYLDAAPALPPCLAIGGITPERVRDLVTVVGSPADGQRPRWGVAVCGAVCGAEDPERVCRDLLAALNAPGNGVPSRAG